MRSARYHPAGIISRHPTGVRRPGLHRLFEIQEAMPAPIRFTSDLKEDSVSEMAEGAASLSPISGVDYPNIRVVVSTDPLWSQDAVSLRCGIVVRFRGALRQEEAKTSRRSVT